MNFDSTLIRKISSSLNRKKLDEQLQNVKDAQKEKQFRSDAKPDTVVVNKIISSRLNGKISNKEFHHTDLKKGKTHVKSTAIDSVRYDPSNNHLYVTYTSGPKEYVFDADEKTFQKFMRAGSKGRFAHYILKQNNQAPKSWY